MCKLLCKVTKRDSIFIHVLKKKFCRLTLKVAKGFLRWIGKKYLKLKPKFNGVSGLRKWVRVEVVDVLLPRLHCCPLLVDDLTGVDLAGRVEVVVEDDLDPGAVADVVVELEAQHHLVVVGSAVGLVGVVGEEVADKLAVGDELAVRGLSQLMRD